VADHLPPLSREEPKEMTIGEEENAEEEEDDSEPSESDYEAIGQESAGRRTRGTKRGAASSSQTSCEVGP
jgi:hypothetical protein